jgi:putative membrane protein
MLTRPLKHWLVGIISVIITILIMRLLPASYQLTWQPMWGVVIFVPILAIVNAILGNILRLLTLPISCMTLGLLGFVINAIVFWVAGSATGAETGNGHSIGFIISLIGSVLYTAISVPLSSLFKERR